MEAVTVINGANPYAREFIDRYFNNRWWYGITLEEMINRSCDLFLYKEVLVAQIFC